MIYNYVVVIIFLHYFVFCHGIRFHFNINNIFNFFASFLYKMFILSCILYTYIPLTSGLHYRIYFAYIFALTLYVVEGSLMFMWNTTF